MSFYCEVNGCIELVVTLNDGLAGQAMAAQRTSRGRLCVFGKAPTRSSVQPESPGKRGCPPFQAATAA